MTLTFDLLMQKHRPTANSQ